VKAFSDLYAALDATTKTNEKIEALTRYLSTTPPEDAIWGIAFLIGRRPKRLIESRKLAQWALDEARMPEWIFGECYSALGDFAEAPRRVVSRRALSPAGGDPAAEVAPAACVGDVRVVSTFSQRGE